MSSVVETSRATSHRCATSLGFARDERVKSSGRDFPTPLVSSEVETPRAAVGRCATSLGFARDERGGGTRSSALSIALHRRFGAAILARQPPRGFAGIALGEFGQRDAGALGFFQPGHRYAEVEQAVGGAVAR